jgi:endonuclease V-like protein UPF0215 family
MSVKRQVRILGIDDSPFTFKSEKALIVGVVARLPMYIEGIMRTEVEVDGSDANEAIVAMVRRSRYREQLRLILFDGVAVGGFNVIDVDRMFRETGIPCATVTREMPDFERMEAALRSHFPDWQERLRVIKRNPHFLQMKDFFKGLGINGPIHHTMVMHWARVIELVHAAELMLELSQDPEITSKDIQTPPGEPGEGVGCLEAPRGTLIHHYVADKNGITTDVNLVVGTTNNNAPINLSVRQAAKGLIKNWQISDGILNEVEMAYRAYDPCNSCATHTLPGHMPLRAIVRNPDGSVYQDIKNF